MGRGVRHAPSGARRTQAAVFAGEGGEQLLAAGGTADPGEAVAKQAAAQVALELAGNEVGEFAAGVAFCGFGQERSQVLANDAVQQRPLGLSAPVANPRTGWTRGDRRLSRCAGGHRKREIISRAKVRPPRVATEGCGTA